MKKFIDHVCCVRGIRRTKNILGQIADMKRIKPFVSAQGG
jgi:hypothetical protein